MTSVRRGALAGPRRSALLRDESGVAYTEFLIAFPPFFLLFLCSVQLGMMYNANIVVGHAAAVAARSAMVVLDDDPQYYEGAARNTIGNNDGSRPGGSPSGTVGAARGALSMSSLPSASGAAGFFKKLGTQDITVAEKASSAGLGKRITDGVLNRLGGSYVPGRTPYGGQRLNVVRDAASIPLLALAPDFSQLMRREQSIKDRLDRSSVSGLLTGLLMYNRFAVIVKFVTPGQVNERTGVAQNARLRVRYLYHCGVPVAAKLLCQDIFTLRFGNAVAEGTALATRAAANAVPMTIPYTDARGIPRVRVIWVNPGLREVGREAGRVGRQALDGRYGNNDLGDAEDPNVGLVLAAAAGNPRYMLLSRDVQVPVHRASYRYASERRTGTGITTGLPRLPPEVGASRPSAGGTTGNTIAGTNIAENAVDPIAAAAAAAAARALGVPTSVFGPATTGTSTGTPTATGTSSQPVILAPPANLPSIFRLP